MRKGFFRVVGGLLVLVLAFVGLVACFDDGVIVGAEVELIRIHIRANSNSEADQAVKLLVRDAVTEYLNDELAGVCDRESAYAGLFERKKDIGKICDAVLKAEDFDYSSSVSLTTEYFPTRQYESLTVESGYYDALIIELGNGEGDNWWCVIYPPLCYLEADYGTGIRYKSKLKELINKYFADSTTDET